jgi:hypothetical protein
MGVCDEDATGERDSGGWVGVVRPPTQGTHARPQPGVRGWGAARVGEWVGAWVGGWEGDWLEDQ